MCCSCRSWMHRSSLSDLAWLACCSRWIAWLSWVLRLSNGICTGVGPRLGPWGGARWGMRLACCATTQSLNNIVWLTWTEPGVYPNSVIYHGCCHFLWWWWVCILYWIDLCWCIISPTEAIITSHLLPKGHMCASTTNSYTLAALVVVSYYIVVVIYFNIQSFACRSLYTRIAQNEIHSCC
jgi:hypothetical protein